MKTHEMVAAMALVMLGLCGCDDDPVLLDAAADTVEDTTPDTTVDVPVDDGPEPTPEALCNDLVVVTCERSFDCFTPDQLAAAGWSTLDDCIVAFHARLNCFTAGTCQDGKVYHNDQAALCVQDMQTQPCGDLIGGIAPTSCTLICQ